MKAPREVLGVGPDADQGEIRRAYKRLALRLHPDRTGGDTRKQAAFQEATTAYKALIKLEPVLAAASSPPPDAPKPRRRRRPSIPRPKWPDKLGDHYWLPVPLMAYAMQGMTAALSMERDVYFFFAAIGVLWKLGFLTVHAALGAALVVVTALVSPWPYASYVMLLLYGVSVKGLEWREWHKATEAWAHKKRTAHDAAERENFADIFGDVHIHWKGHDDDSTD